MACFSNACCNGFLITHEKLGFYGGKTKSLRRCERFCYSSYPFTSVGFCKNYKSQSGLLWNGNLSSLIRDNGRVVPFGFCTFYKLPHGLPCKDEIKPLRSGNNGDKQAYLEKKENSRVRRRFSWRLRPRLRLLTIRMRRVSIRSMLNDVKTFVRKNVRKVLLSSSISVALGMCYLFLKLTALPSPTVVPYSDLIANLQNGSVTKVLLEEGSRRIYFNTNLQSEEDTQKSEGESTAISLLIENEASDVGTRSVPPVNVNVLKKSSRARASVPEWQYATRKVDHDEKFLLNLMREKGTTYSSAPQSVLMSMRNTLITVLTLWIPLIPLMWLLYRQLSAAKSPARKRQRDTEIVGFDDVEGVDTAKVELMEVNISSFEFIANI